MGEPPLLAGAVNLIEACKFPDVAEAIVGAPGITALTVTVTVADADVPVESVAVYVKLSVPLKFALGVYVTVVAPVAFPVTVPLVAAPTVIPAKGAVTPVINAARSMELLVVFVLTVAVAFDTVGAAHVSVLRPNPANANSITMDFPEAIQNDSKHDKFRTLASPFIGLWSISRSINTSLIFINYTLA